MKEKARKTASGTGTPTGLPLDSQVRLVRLAEFLRYLFLTYRADSRPGTHLRSLRDYAADLGAEIYDCMNRVGIDPTAEPERLPERLAGLPVNSSIPFDDFIRLNWHYMRLVDCIEAKAMRSRSDGGERASADCKGKRARAKRRTERKTETRKGNKR